MKEYNITLSEALTFLNERHFTKKGFRTYTDSSSPFYIDSVLLKSLVEQEKIDAYHSGIKYCFNINDLKELKDNIDKIITEYQTKEEAKNKKYNDKVKSHNRKILLTDLIILLIFNLFYFKKGLFTFMSYNLILNTIIYGFIIIVIVIILSFLFVKEYKTQYDPFNGPIDKYLSKIPNIHTKDDFVGSKNRNNFVLREEVNQKFKANHIECSVPLGFTIIPTFRDQNSTSWKGRREMFEDLLVKQNIKWFVYIKYAKNLFGKNFPLVVGKSGSKLVNNSGSDVSFSEDSNHGPARRYLKENNFEWNKTYIAIYPCETEREAYNKEKEIAIKYKLFES